MESASRAPGMDLAAAEAKCTELRGLASTIVDNLGKRLQAQLGAPGGAGRSLDKGGAEVQSEALTISLLMSGRPADDHSRASVIEQLRAHDASPKVAAFLQYWAQLALMEQFDGSFSEGGALNSHGLLGMRSTAILWT